MTDAEQREILCAYRPWLRTVAANMCWEYSCWAEDCAAEGWIAMWRGLGSHDAALGPRDAWPKRLAVHRMIQVVAGWKRQCRPPRTVHLGRRCPTLRATHRMPRGYRLHERHMMPENSEQSRVEQMREDRAIYWSVITAAEDALNGGICDDD